MKYLVIGAGGTGGCIGGFLSAGGKDVTFIARNAHLKALKQNGILIHTTKGDKHAPSVKAFSEEEFEGKADVIFLCVKSYSVDSVMDLVKKAAHEGTVVIPTLNVFGIGDMVAQKLPGITVLDGCIYISAFLSAPGEATLSVDLFKIVFGNRAGEIVDRNILLNVQRDLEDSGVTAVISDNIKRDTFKKFTFISSYASAGAYHNATASQMQKEGEIRDTFFSLNKELSSIAKILNIELEEDILTENCKILDQMAPEVTASMQKDMEQGKKDERDQIIFEVVRIAQKNQISVPTYQKIADHFGFK